jgi:hypothetical protein
MLAAGVVGIATSMVPVDSKMKVGPIDDYHKILFSFYTHLINWLVIFWKPPPLLFLCKIIYCYIGGVGLVC